MRAISRSILWIVRLAGTLQLVLGALFWTGHAYTYVPLHLVGGVVIVLALWTAAVLALFARTHRGLALFGLGWGVALSIFGMSQASLLVGPMHWIVRVTHLVMGLAAMALAAILSQAILASKPARVRDSSRDGKPVPLEVTPRGR
jgi:hypothetical protein